MPRSKSRGGGLTADHPDAVPVENLQRAYRDSGMTATAAARACGWDRRYRRPDRPSARQDGDASRFLRTIGLREQKSGAGRKYTRRFVRYKMAVKVVRALGGDPVDYGV